MQELLVFRHGSEDLVSQSHENGGPIRSRIKITALTPLPLKFQLNRLSRTPSPRPAAFVTLRRSDHEVDLLTPSMQAETSVQDTNAELTRQLQLANDTIRQARTTIAEFQRHDSSSSFSSGSGSSERRSSPARHHSSRRAEASRRRADREERRELRQTEKRREERREEERHAERLRDHQADRLAMAEQLAALKFSSGSGSRAQYRIGAALKDFRSFDGAPGADGATYLLELTHLLGTHEIPADMWPRELSLKLTGKARNWYASRFPGLHAGTFPPWAELYAAMLLAYSQLYQAAGAYRALHSATRVPGTTGKEALNRIDELAMLLQRTGVNKPGDAEQMAYILQNQLQPEELSRWTALANSDSTISDAGLNELELGASTAQAGRFSCAPLTREAFFAGRTEHLRNFLRDLGVATGGRTGPGGQAARAAVSLGASDDPTYRDEPRVSVETLAPSATVGAGLTEREATLLMLTGKWNNRRSRAGPPPEYYPKDPAKNQAVFDARKAAKECFGCNVHGELVPNQPHWDCKLHGVDASEASRARRVPGSGGKHQRDTRH